MNPYSGRVGTLKKMSMAVRTILPLTAKNYKAVGKDLQFRLHSVRPFSRTTYGIYNKKNY